MCIHKSKGMTSVGPSAICMFDPAHVMNLVCQGGLHALRYCTVALTSNARLQSACLGLTKTLAAG